MQGDSGKVIPEKDRAATTPSIGQSRYVTLVSLMGALRAFVVPLDAAPVCRSATDSTRLHPMPQGHFGNIAAGTTVAVLMGW